MRIVLGVSGGVAAYKAAELARALPRAQFDRDRQAAAARGRPRQHHGALRIRQQRRSGPGLADLRHRTSHVDVNQVCACGSHLLGGRGHDGAHRRASR